MKANILILGASGFVGSHLTAELIKQKKHVRLLVRNPHKLKYVDQYTEIVIGDVLDEGKLSKALEGIDTIYYLIHGMGQVDSFEELEAKQANSLKKYLEENHRVIYLSGLGENPNSKHLKSRKNVGELLRSSKAKVLELQASIIIGEGSTSFDLIRATVERFPFVLKTSWSQAKCQPLALDDLLKILLYSLEIPMEKSLIAQIGGPDILSYSDLLVQVAKVRKLHRPIISNLDIPKEFVLKMLKIFLSEYYGVGSKLMESIEIPTIVHQEFPKFADLSKENITEAIQKAIQRSSKSWKSWEQNDWDRINSDKDATEILQTIEIVDERNITLPISQEKLKVILDKVTYSLNLVPSFKARLHEDEDDNYEMVLTIGRFTHRFKVMIKMCTDKKINLVVNWIYKPLGYIDSLSFKSYQAIFDRILNKMKIVSGLIK